MFNNQGNDVGFLQDTKYRAVTLDHTEQVILNKGNTYLIINVSSEASKNTCFYSFIKALIHISLLLVMDSDCS